MRLQSDNKSESKLSITSEQNTTKKTKVELFKTRVQLSLTKSLIFMISFSCIGGYIIYKSFAIPADIPSNNLQESRLMMRFKPNATKAQRDAIFKNNNLKVIDEIPQIGIKVVKVPAVAKDAVTKALNHNPIIDFIEEDSLVEAQEQLPDDPFFPAGLNTLSMYGGAWGWSSTRTTEAWDITMGDPSVVIAVLDTGLRSSVIPDFDGQVVTGWNLLNNTTNTDVVGDHGTRVAGVIGLAIKNGIGHAGYCPKCKVMPVVVGTDAGAYSGTIASGIIWAADHGAKIANISWAGPSSSLSVNNAVAYARSKGVVIFAGAGNSDCDCIQYPAGTPGVIGVAGVDKKGVKSAGSNYGSWVAVGAPDGNITAWPVFDGGMPGYVQFGGTSSASPAAAAIAGLILSYNKSLSGLQVEEIIKNSTSPVAFTLKYGQVDALAALQSMGASNTQSPSVPVNITRPQILLQTAGTGSTTSATSNVGLLTRSPQVGQVLVRGQGSWSGSNGLSIGSIRWYRCSSNNLDCALINSTSGAYQVQVADTGSSIKFSITIKNSLGSTTVESPLSQPVGGSASDTVLPTISLTYPGNGAILSGTTTLSATATDNLGVTKVEFYVDGGLVATTTTMSGSTSYSASWNTATIINGTHTISAKAYDAAGNVGVSTNTSIAISNLAPLAVPTGLAPTPQDKSVTLTWNANSETNLAGYELQYKTINSNIWTLVSDITNITYNITGLTNGISYEFRLRAKDTSGNTTAWTAIVSAVPLPQTIDTTPPMVTISSPSNGSSIAGTRKVSILANANDDNVVIKLELYIDNQLKLTVTESNLIYSWNTNKSVKGGIHTITVKAYDANSNVGQSQVVVTK